MNEKPIPPIQLHYATGKDASEAEANLIQSHDPSTTPLPDGLVSAGIRLHPGGKAYAWADAPAPYGDALNKALAKSLMLGAYIDGEVFRQVARSGGVSESVIDEALRSARIQDEVYFERPTFEDDPKVRFIVPSKEK